MKYYSEIKLKNMFRKRICDLIGECIKYPVLSIEAGTGFGKSVAVNQYLQESSKNYIHIRFNHLDNIPEQFWLKYTKALSKFYPDTAEELRHLGFPSTNSEINNCLHILAYSYYTLEEDLCFIMDGFHLLTEPSILYFLEHVLQLETEYLHTILISAHKHHLDLNSFYQAETIRTIGKDDLCFTREEIAEYFTELGIAHDDEMIDEVYSFAEGWAFAIKLSAFYLKNDTSQKDINEKVLPTIFDLMDTYAFDGYSQKYKDVLTALSYLHTIPVNLVISITGLTHDEIRDLAISNPFIQFDERSGVIELHKIYLKFLKTKRRYVPDDKMNELTSLIGGWYYENEFVFDALDFFNQSKNYDKICVIIRTFKNKKLSRDMAYYLLKIIAEIPLEVIDKNPDLPLYEALFFFNNNRLELAQDILRHYEAKLLRKEINDEIVQLLGETYLLLGLIRLFMLEMDFDLYFKWADNKLEDGSQLFDQTYPLLDINHGLLCRSLAKEDIDNALYAMKHGFPYFIKLTHGCGAGMIELASGELSFLKGDLREAEEYLYAGMFKAKEHKQADIVLTIYFLLFRIGIAKGNSEMALEYIDKVKHFNEQGEYPKRDYPLKDIALAWLALKMESPKNIAKWLISGENLPDDISKRNEGRNLTLYAHWLLAVKKSPVEALVYIEKIEEFFVKHNLYTSLVYCYQLKYTAYKLLGRDQKECFELIELIYDLIKECELLMFIVENGSATRSGLMAYKKYKDKRIPDKWIDKAITKSMTYGKYLNTFKLKYQKKMDCLPDIDLTDNEKALLDGLCFGLSRAEIAEENHITENTVKSQLKNIYNKLSAANQAEAVYIYTTMYSA